jgi:hypothetical protein
MPVTRSRNDYPVHDPANTTRFLFGDEDSHGFALGQNGNEEFPTLVRRKDQMVSAKCNFPLDF